MFLFEQTSEDIEAHVGSSVAQMGRRVRCDSTRVKRQALAVMVTIVSVFSCKLCGARYMLDALRQRIVQFQG
jgi:hypothetical protein